MTLENVFGELALDATVAEIPDSGEREYVHVPVLVTAAGDTVVAGVAGSGVAGANPPYVLAPGKSIRVRWLYSISDPTAASTPVMNWRLGSVPLFCVFALSKRQRKTGAPGAPLVLNLSAPGNVAVTAIIEEI